jgi:hypothetical protein
MLYWIVSQRGTRKSRRKRKEIVTMGMIYKRGNTFWIKYYRNGKPFYESSGSDKETDAKKLLKSREGSIVDGKFQGLSTLMSLQQTS